MADLELSVALPAYLEEENLRLLLPRLKETLEKIAPSSYEILVLDTEKPLDRTEDACRAHAVTYCPRQGGNRFGDAVRTGIEKARGKYILFMDADGSHTPEYIPELFQYRANHDIVIASRYVEGGATENPRVLILMSRILNVAYAVILGLRYKDVSNSFKLYRAELLKSLDLVCDNFDVIEEILFKISRSHRGLRVKEVPFTFKKRMFGQTKRKLLWFVLTYVWTMTKLRFSVTSKGRKRIRGKSSELADPRL